jgi:WD40 repeat protein
LADDPKVNPDRLWEAWREFQALHAGEPEWRLAAARMVKVSSPLDRLDGTNIPSEGRSFEPPKELVGALGGNRGMHQGMVGRVAVSGDGRTVVSESHGIHFWDPETMLEKACDADDGRWGPIALFPDGKTMVTCGKNGDTLKTSIRIWDLSGEEPKVRAILPGHGELAIEGLALAADHKTLFTTECEGRLAENPKVIRVWDIGSQKPGELQSIKIDEDGFMRADARRHLVCASRSMTFVDIGGANDAPVRVWDLDKNPPRVRCRVAAWSAGNTPGPMAISPDGKTLAIRHIRDKAIVLWDVSAAEAKGIERFDAGRYSALTFLPSGNVLAWADRDDWLILRPLNADGRSEVKLEDGQTTVAIPLGFQPTSLAFTDDGKTAVMGGEDHIVHVWDLDKGKERFPPTGHRGGIRALAFSPDAKTLASGGAEGSIRLWDLTGAAGKPIGVLTGHTNLGGLAFAPDGKSLVSCGLDVGAKPDRTVRLWDLSGKEPRQKTAWEPHRFGTNSVALSPAGGLLATAGADGMASFGENWHGCVRLWDLSEDPPAERAAVDLNDRDKAGKLVALQMADHAAFDARGKTLGVLTGQRTLRLFDVTDKGLKAGPTLQPFARELGVNTWAFSPDCSTLATLGNGPPEKLPDDTGILSLWRRDGDSIKPWPGFTPVPWEGHSELVFSPDGRRVAGVNFDGDLLIYDVPSGEIVYQWMGAGAARVAFAPDGRHLAVGGSNSVIYILRLPAAQ